GRGGAAPGARGGAGAGVIAVPPGVRILLAAEPVDFHKGMDGLAALVQQACAPTRSRATSSSSAPGVATGSRSWSTTAPACTNPARGTSSKKPGRRSGGEGRELDGVAEVGEPADEPPSLNFPGTPIEVVGAEVRVG